jgi:hypothetical protein
LKRSGVQNQGVVRVGSFINSGGKICLMPFSLILLAF